MKYKCIFTPSTMRHFPNSPLPTKKLSVIDAALNESFSFQMALRADEHTWFRAEIEAPKGWEARVRRVGFVPVQHHNTPILDAADSDGIGHLPGFVPDPLYDENTMTLPQNETNAFWFTVKPNKTVKAGSYPITVTLTRLDWQGNPYGKPTKHTITARIHNIAIKPRKDFHVTHWFYADCLQTWYKTYTFTDEFWTILEKYLRNIAQHGQNVIYVPLFTPSLDTDHYPSQLLKVTKKGKGKYAFDWTDVRRYIKLAKKCGIDTFEWAHLFSQWGCKHAIKIFEGQGEGEKALWEKETPATGEIYRNFMKQLLPEFKAFLTEEKILKKSLFHISDEPHGDQKPDYVAAKKMMNELAPWMTFIDAVSDIEFGRDGTIDMPVPSIRTALDFYKEGITSWCYYCCSPREKYLQHLMDTPLAKVAMHGFLFYRWPFKGFLHWGLNYWNISQTRTLLDPFVNSDGLKWPGWAYGDTFLIYPGKDGPIDSVRWEIFAEAMQDYALLQTLGIDREDKLLSAIKSFEDFPKDASWRQKARAKLFSLV